jgi:FtsP/CotA-like multicopper oxidase with cupredoxin domain
MDMIAHCTRCLPPQLAVGQGDFPHNLSAAPQGLWFGCQASTGSAEVLNVDAKTQYVSYDVISAAGTSTFIFSIDEHPVWVYAVDGRYVTPTLVDAFTISNGQRFSILVKLDKPAALYNIRTVVSGLNQIMAATSYLSYAGRLKLNYSSQPYITLNGTGLTSETVFWEEAAAIPFPPVAPSLKSDETYILPIARYKASYNWTLGSTQYPTFQAGGEEPLLFNLNAQGFSSSWEIRTQNGSWVDLVIVTEGVAPPHPIHKHSNKYFVIGKGTGPWNYTSVADAIAAQPSSFNLANPPMRDTYSTPAAAGDGSWLVLRYQVVNPGAFLLHCHIQSHLDGGMAINLLDGIDKWPAVPANYLHSNGF